MPAYRCGRTHPGGAGPQPHSMGITKLSYLLCRMVRGRVRSTNRGDHAGVGADVVRPEFVIIDQSRRSFVVEKVVAHFASRDELLPGKVRDMDRIGKAG